MIKRSREDMLRTQGKGVSVRTYFTCISKQELGTQPQREATSSPPRIHITHFSMTHELYFLWCLLPSQVVESHKLLSWEQELEVGQARTGPWRSSYQTVFSGVLMCKKGALVPASLTSPKWAPIWRCHAYGTGVKGTPGWGNWLASSSNWQCVSWDPSSCSTESSL